VTKSSGMLCHVNWQIASDISKDCGTFKHSMKTYYCPKEGNK